MLNNARTFYTENCTIGSRFVITLVLAIVMRVVQVKVLGKCYLVVSAVPCIEVAISIIIRAKYFH